MYICTQAHALLSYRAIAAVLEQLPQGVAELFGHSWPKGLSYCQYIVCLLFGYPSSFGPSSTGRNLFGQGYTWPK